jgi:hypothetical protein
MGNRLTEWMVANGIAVTRESYCSLAWGATECDDGWNPEQEFEHGECPFDVPVDEAARCVVVPARQESSSPKMGELKKSYSITSSARPSSVMGNVRPSAFAVFSSAGA